MIAKSGSAPLGGSRRCHARIKHAGRRQHVLKASDLAGKPMVSEAGQMGYRVTDLMVDRPRAAVSYLAVSRDEDPGGRERLKLDQGARDWRPTPVSGGR